MITTTMVVTKLLNCISLVMGRLESWGRNRREGEERSIKMSKKRKKKPYRSWKEAYAEWLTRIGYKPPPPLEKGPVSLRDGIPVYGKQVHTGPSPETLRKRGRSK